MQEAPGTLDAESQRRLMAQITQLIYAAYGPKSAFAITVMREVERDQLAVYTMGTTSTEVMAWMFRNAADALSESRVRMLTIED